MDYLNMMSYSLSELIGLIIMENPTSEVVKGVEDLIISDRHILEVTREELLQVKGISSKRADAILAAIQLNRICNQPLIVGTRININSPKDVANLLMPEMRYLDCEHFKIIMLNIKNDIIGIDTISIGNLNSAIVDPKQVFKSALKRSSASIILTHGHPSGLATPSREDIDLTIRLIEGGKLLGIEVLDHIIIGDGTFISLKEKMLI